MVNPRVLCCFLRLSLTEVPSLHRHYPASSVLRTSPPPQAAQPVSHEVPVDRQDDHRWGFPCCYWSTLPTCRRHYPGRSDGTRSLVLSHQRRPAHITRGEGSCVNRFEACSAFTSRYGLHARQVTYVTLYTGGSDGFVSSTAAPIASGWSEPSSRAGLSPAVDQRLFTAHVLSGFINSCEVNTARPSEFSLLMSRQSLPKRYESIWCGLGCVFVPRIMRSQLASHRPSAG